MTAPFLAIIGAPFLQESKYQSAIVNFSTLVLSTEWLGYLISNFLVNSLKQKFNIVTTPSTSAHKKLSLQRPKLITITPFAILFLLVFIPLGSLLINSSNTFVLNFHIDGLQISSAQRYYLAFMQIISIVYFFSKKKVSHVDFFLESLLLLFLPICYFLSGFRNPFIIPFSYAIATVLRIQLPKNIIRITYQKIVNLIINLKLRKSIFRSFFYVVSCYLAFVILTSYSFFTRKSSIVLPINIFKQFFSEMAIGASFGMDKYLAVNTSSPPVLDFSPLCLFYDYPGVIVPRYIWQQIRTIFINSDCISISSLIDGTNIPISSADGFGTASNYFADVTYYFGFSYITYLLTLSIFVFILSLLKLLYDTYTTNKNSILTRFLFVTIVTTPASISVLWRSSIFDILSLNIMFLALLCIIIRLTNRQFLRS